MVDFFELFGFYNPERLFKYRLEHNPYYPFMEVLPKVFVLRDASSWYIFEASAVVILACVYIIVLVTASWPLQLLIFPIVFVIVVLPVVLRRRKKRTLVYDGDALIYEYYVDDELVYQGHCHNLYIRLKGESGGTEEAHYYSVVVNGYGVREYPVTMVSKKREKMYKMGRRLASNLNLNFFDSADRSTNHVVRHYCPQVESVPEHHEVHKGV